MSQLVPLLFDLDGTMTNPAPGFFASVRYALEKLEVPCPANETLERYIGPPLRDTFGTIIGTDDPEVIEKAVELYRWRLDNGGKFEAAVHAGIPELLSHFFEKGHPLYVCTGKPEGVAGEIVEHFELMPFFRRVYGAKLDGRHCDKADLIQHIWAEEGFETPYGVMIGDTIFDIQGAKANRLGVIGVRWGFGEDEDLLEAGADCLVSDADELREQISVLLKQ